MSKRQLNTQLYERIENHAAAIWTLRILAAFVMVMFFVPVYNVHMTLTGSSPIAKVSLYHAATGTGNAFNVLRLTMPSVPQSFPVLFLFLLPPVAAIALSFIPRLKFCAKYIYCLAFALCIAVIVGLFAFMIERINNVHVIPTAWWGLWFFLTLAGFILATGVMLDNFVKKIKEMP